MYRCLGTSAISKRGRAIGTSLLPHQVSVGVRAGGEIAAVLADLGYLQQFSDEGYRAEGIATLNVDLANAFNTMPRSQAAKGLQGYAPELLCHFNHVYGQPVRLRDSQGNLLGHSRAGLIQGDPMAMLMFCVGEQPIIQDIDRELKRLEAEYLDEDDDKPRGFVVCFADDITVHGATPVIFALAPYIEQLFHNIGMTINLSKSFILGTEVNRTPDPPSGWLLLR